MAGGVEGGGEGEDVGYCAVFVLGEGCEDGVGHFAGRLGILVVGVVRLECGLLGWRVCGVGDVGGESVIWRVGVCLEDCWGWDGAVIFVWVFTRGICICS